MLEVRKREKRYGLIDLETGEKFEGVITPWFPKIGGKWVRVFQDAKRELMERSPDMHGQSHRILNHLEAIVGWGNSIPAPSIIASTLGIHQVAAFRGYAELIKANFILKRGGAYFLNPLVCWKGDEQQLRQACRELAPPLKVLALPQPLLSHGPLSASIGKGYPRRKALKMGFEPKHLAQEVDADGYPIPEY